jgi:predicted lipid-binding transport protein (Tim44 family)
MAMKFTKTLSAVVIAAAVAFGATVAEAKKFGGGKSVGSQRDAVTQRQAGGPTAAPATPNTAAAAAPAAGAAAGAAAKTGMAKWAGPIAAIAAGLGLGLLFSQLGAGGFLMFLLVAVAFLIGMVFLARRMMRNQATANGAPMQYQGAQHEPLARQPANFGSSASAPAMASGLAGGFGIPAGFDKAGFEENAKKQFMALQAANDKGDLDAVRDFATDELYNQIAKDVISGNKEATQVDELNAELLGIETERGNYWASVEFSGKMREDGMMMASAFRETWNLVKPVDGSRGWLVAGIQQG